MLYLFWALILVGIYSFITNKNSKICVAIMILGLVILSTAPRTGYDTGNFQALFENIDTYGIEQYNSAFYTTMHPYMYLNIAFQKIGIHSFYLMKGIVIILLTFIVYKTFGKLSNNPALLLFFYLVSTFSIDAIQFRNTIGMMLFLIGTYYLIADKKNGTLRFCLFVLLAGVIHVTFLIYLLMIFAKKSHIELENLTKIIGIITIALLMFIRIDSGALSDVAQLLSSGGSVKLQAYFANRTNFGFIYPFIIYLFVLMLLYVCYHNLKIIDVNGSELLYQAKIILHGNIMIFPTIIFSLYSLSTDRMLRNLTVLNLLILTNYSSKKSTTISNRISNQTIVLLWCLFNLIYINFITGPASDILYAIFNGKLFFLS